MERGSLPPTAFFFQAEKLRPDEEKGFVQRHTGINYKLNPQANAIAIAGGRWKLCQGAIHKPFAFKIRRLCRTIHGDRGRLHL